MRSPKPNGQRVAARQLRKMDELIEQAKQLAESARQDQQLAEQVRRDFIDRQQSSTTAER